jgi:hypothetical protein
MDGLIGDRLLLSGALGPTWYLRPMLADSLWTVEFEVLTTVVLLPPPRL